VIWTVVCICVLSSIMFLKFCTVSCEIMVQCKILGGSLGKRQKEEKVSQRSLLPFRCSSLVIYCAVHFRMFDSFYM
jgi:hypothetical protein